MADTIASRLEEDVINGVQRVSADGVSVDSMSVADRIKADEYIKALAASKKKHRGMTFIPLTPGSCG